MFGLVRRSRLLEAERRLVDMRVTLLREERTSKDLMAELHAEKKLREAAEAERDRLELILISHPIDAATPAPEKPAEPEAAPPIRVLSGTEVVTRATIHRNTHNNKVR